MVALLAADAADKRPARVEITTSSTTAPAPAGAWVVWALSDAALPDNSLPPSATDSAPGWIPAVLIFTIARPTISKCYYLSKYYYSTINIDICRSEFTEIPLFGMTEPAPTSPARTSPSVHCQWS